MGAIGAVLAGFLAFADKKLKVEEDPMVEALSGALPGSNCGGCGFAGCRMFAEALMKGNALPNACVAGGSETAKAVAEILGVDAGSMKRNIAVVAPPAPCPHLAAWKAGHGGAQAYIPVARALRKLGQDLEGARRLVVVGAGYVGLEAAASARHLGLDVTVLEMADRPMSRVVAPQLSDFYLHRHEREGVRIHCGTSVTAFEGTGRVRAVVCGDQSFPADLVIVGVGILPNVSLAAAAGIRCENGVWVDEQCRTSDPSVWAAGDCTNHPSVRYGRRVRLESVDNAVEQGRVAATNMCGGQARHELVPWFWSDQHDLNLQIAGLSQGHDQVVLRGDPETRSFALYYLAQGELLAVDAVISPRDFMTGKRWIAERKHPDPAKLGDTNVDLKTL